MKKLKYILITICLLMPSLVYALEIGGLNSKHVIVYNKDNNKILYEKNSKDEKLVDDYKELEKKYDNLLEEKVEDRSSDEVIEENSCKKELEKVTLKNDDNEKKLKLSNQAYDYLNSSLLKVNNNGFELELSWYLWLLFLILLLLIIIVMILKKRKTKNKF